MFFIVLDIMKRYVAKYKALVHPSRWLGYVIALRLGSRVPLQLQDWSS